MRTGLLWVITQQVVPSTGVQVLDLWEWDR